MSKLQSDKNVDIFGRLVFVAAVCFVLIKFNYEISRFFLSGWDVLWGIRDSICAGMARTLDDCPATIGGVLKQLVLMILFAVVWIVLFLVFLLVAGTSKLLGWLNASYILPFAVPLLVIYSRFSYSFIARPLLSVLRAFGRALKAVFVFLGRTIRLFFLLPIAEVISSKQRPAFRVYRATTSVLFFVACVSLTVGILGILSRVTQQTRLLARIDEWISTAIGEASPVDGFRDDQHAVEVWAKHPFWTETGIVVKSGERISFSARGTIYTGEPFPTDARGPNGLFWATGGSITPSRLTSDYRKADYKPQSYMLTDAPIGCLIGKVGADQPFIIGESCTYKADNVGQILLAINEPWVAGMWEDNKGMFTVDVVVQRR